MICYLRFSMRVVNFSILTTGTDLSGSTDTTYTPNGYTLINTNPYYFVRSGSVYGSTLYHFTGDASYWSSTAVSASQAYYLYFGSSAVFPAYRDGRGRYVGRSLRCVTPRIRFSNYLLQILPQKLTSWSIRSLGKFLWRSLCHYLSTFQPTFRPHIYHPVC